MIPPPPAPVHEALIQSVPILIGRTNDRGVIQETEGTLPHADALGDFECGTANLLEIFPDDAEQIQTALAGGSVRIDASTDDDEPAHFEVRVIGARARGSGAYFLVHDITETRQLQLALLDCTDREQMRIGQELHDTLGQELTGIAYQLHAVLKHLPAAQAVIVGGLQERVSGSLRQAREIAFKLSPRIAGEEICKVFGRLCRHIGETFDIECTFDSSLDHPITDDATAHHLFRIAQEACTNAVRHGTPTHIGIRLVTGVENLLEISDDGTGTASAAAPSRFPGTGIPMMRFRAQALGGTLRVLPRQPAGTLVRCRFANASAADSPPPSESCASCL